MRIRDIGNFRLRNTIVTCINSPLVFIPNKQFFEDYGGLRCQFEYKCIILDIDPDLFELMKEKYEKETESLCS